MRRTEPGPSAGLTPALLTLPKPAPVSAPVSAPLSAPESAPESAPVSAQSPTPVSGRPAHPGA